MMNPLMLAANIACLIQVVASQIPYNCNSCRVVISGKNLNHEFGLTGEVGSHTKWYCFPLKHGNPDDCESNNNDYQEGILIAYRDGPTKTWYQLKIVGNSLTLDRTRLAKLRNLASPDPTEIFFVSKDENAGGHHVLNSSNRYAVGNKNQPITFVKKMKDATCGKIVNEECCHWRCCDKNDRYGKNFAKIQSEITRSLSRMTKYMSWIKKSSIYKNRLAQQSMPERLKHISNMNDASSFEQKRKNYAHQ